MSSHPDQCDLVAYALNLHTATPTRSQGIQPVADRLTAGAE
jgi:hypothetical protein